MNLGINYADGEFTGCIGIIQLENVDGHPIGLYMYDRSRHSEQSAVNVVERTFEDCVDEDNPQAAADDNLLNQGIERIYAAQATTQVL